MSRMSTGDDALLSALIIALFGLLGFLRMRFPKASRNAEVIALVSATIAFFAICSFFPGSGISLSHIRSGVSDPSYILVGRVTR